MRTHVAGRGAKNLLAMDCLTSAATVEILTWRSRLFYDAAFLGWFAGMKGNIAAASVCRPQPAIIIPILPDGINGVAIITDDEAQRIAAEWIAPFQGRQIFQQCAMFRFKGLDVAHSD